MSDSEKDFEKALSELKFLQSLIDNIETYLKGLRTQCKPNDEFTQKEIRVTEGKLVVYVSKQIIIKNKLSSDSLHDKLADYPNTYQWLSCVGLPENTIKGVLKEEKMNLYSLLEMSETKIKTLLTKHGGREEDSRRLNLALRNLTIATERELSGGNSASDSDIELHWTNPDSTSSYSDYIPRRSPRPSTSSLSSSDNSTTMGGVPAQTHSTPPSPVPHAHNTHSERLRSVGYTPPATPPSVRTPKTKYPITPPPQKKMLLFPEYPTISRSKSQESQLAHKVQDIDPVRSGKKKPVNQLNLGSNTCVNIGGSHDLLPFRRHSNEHDTGRSSRGPSGPASPIINSPIHSPPYVQDGSSSLVVPNIGAHVMKHQINHKLISKISFGSTCDVCGSNIFWGKHCKYCKFKCHRECVHKEAPSCGLSEELVNVATKTYFEGASNPRRTPELQRHRNHHHHHQQQQQAPLQAFPGADSSSASSSNSSTHTSPSPYASPHLHLAESFQFPDTLMSESSTDVTQTEPVLSGDWDRDVDVVSTNTSNDSDKTIVDSNTSEVTVLDRVDSVDSQEDPLGQHTWKRVCSLSVALKEWDIPYEELTKEMLEPIGTGRFGTVYKGQWHGDVAIKMLNMDPNTDNAAQLSAFKLEVAMLRKTRHENLVLFMGACMKPPHLGIVTSLCRGSSLYTLLHVRKEKFAMSKSIIIAQQVSQGMGYLHAKGIVHKDLKTKNIFFDKDKVVITDFGLFNVTKLCHANRHADRLQIPPGWLCYLSPEIIKSLLAGAAYASTELPFSQLSDVYAFGTVWYELLNGNWPFERQPPESIIWQVGHGLKPSFGSIKGSKEVKDMLLMCWSYNPEDRPGFSQLLRYMERLPKKPFTRSPSHPIHLLSRSADSLHTS
ncbi:3-dehydrosphinganine reductase [Mactra antiquata]